MELAFFVFRFFLFWCSIIGSFTLRTIEVPHSWLVIQILSIRWKWKKCMWMSNWRFESMKEIYDGRVAVREYSVAPLFCLVRSCARPLLLAVDYYFSSYVTLTVTETLYKDILWCHRVIDIDSSMTGPRKRKLTDWPLTSDLCLIIFLLRQLWCKVYYLLVNIMQINASRWLRYQY